MIKQASFRNQNLLPYPVMVARFLKNFCYILSVDFTLSWSNIFEHIGCFPWILISPVMVQGFHCPNTMSEKSRTNWPSIMSVAESALSGICTNIPSKLKISRMLFQVCKDITVKLLLIFKQFHILFKKVFNDQMHAALAGDINFHIFDISPLLNIFDVVYHTYTKNSTLYRNTSEIQKFSIMLTIHLFHSAKKY